MEYFRVQSRVSLVHGVCPAVGGDQGGGGLSDEIAVIPGDADSIDIDGVVNLPCIIAYQLKNGVAVSFANIERNMFAILELTVVY